MDEREFAEALTGMLEYGEESLAGDGERPRVSSFEDVGMLTRNTGLVIRMADGAEFQLTIVRSA